MSDSNLTLDNGGVEFRPHSFLKAREEDPVCGIEVTRNEGTNTVVHNGKKYYFCSTLCRARFFEDPWSFS